MAHVVLDRRLAEAGLADRVERHQLRHRRLARRPADGRPGRRDAGRAGYDPSRHRARQFDGLATTTTTWCWRWTPRTSPTSAAAPRPGRCCSASSIRSWRGGDVPDPYYGGAPASRRSSRWSNAPAAALVVELRAALDAPGRDDPASRWSPAAPRSCSARRWWPRHRWPAATSPPPPGCGSATARTALMKTLPHAPEDFFTPRRAACAGWPRRPRRRRAVPEVLGGRPGVPDPALGRAGQEPRSTPRPPSAARWPATHAAGAPSFGLDHDGFIGRLPLPNRPAPTRGRSSTPYPPAAALPQAGPRPRPRAAEGRPPRVEAVLRPAGRPGARGAAGPAARRPVERQRAVGRWTAHAGVIDPAAYGGHRETDLAMLALFGLPHLPRVLDAYVEASVQPPLADGWEDRVRPAPAVPAAGARRACSAAGTPPARPTSPPATR